MSDIHTLAGAYALNAIDDMDRARFDRHLAECPACAAEVLLLHRPFPGALGWACAGAALGAQALRWWAISTLGWRWNVRVIVVPGDPVVTRGPYRLVRHPYPLVPTRTLYARADWVEQAWSLLGPVLDGWAHDGAPAPYLYEAGNWGPPEADAFIARDGGAWRTP
jgi:hypothetical protein